MTERSGGELLHIEQKAVGQYAVVALTGELDLSTSVQLRTALTDLRAGQGQAHLVVDLTDLSFMDSTGLGVLVRAHRDAEADGGSFAVVCQPGPARRVMEVTGLLDVLSCHDTLEAATAQPPAT